MNTSAWDQNNQSSQSIPRFSEWPTERMPKGRTARAPSFSSPALESPLAQRCNDAPLTSVQKFGDQSGVHRCEWTVVRSCSEFNEQNSHWLLSRKNMEKVVATRLLPLLSGQRTWPAPAVCLCSLQRSRPVCKVSHGQPWSAMVNLPPSRHSLSHTSSAHPNHPNIQRQFFKVKILEIRAIQCRKCLHWQGREKLQQHRPRHMVKPPPITRLIETFESMAYQIHCIYQ